MKLAHGGHLTYCSNIHPGETWPEVFEALCTHLPVVKEKVCPGQPMGIGLRLSHQASLELQEAGTGDFREWMTEHKFYVFTMNGFPYGGFHRQKVKDQVHQPDWTTGERVDYTIRLFDILAQLLPEGQEGGISTSPLSYKHWWSPGQTEDVFRRSTENILLVLKHLHQYYRHQGILLHLDIEPEPDGLIENSGETIEYFQNWLLPMAREKLGKELGLDSGEIDQIVLRHITLCYDVCHFAVAYESPAEVILKFEQAGIRIGKIQISSALKKEFSGQSRAEIEAAFQKLDEPTYLHQVIARDMNGGLHQYPDLAPGLRHLNDPRMVEWRTHFHVPVFVQSYGLLESTQKDIREVLKIWSGTPLTRHLEVETYTWEVLPKELQKEIDVSIARELNWVANQLKST
jgi:hypothetical protein